MTQQPYPDLESFFKAAVLALGEVADRFATLRPEGEAMAGTSAMADALLFLATSFWATQYHLPPEMSVAERFRNVVTEAVDAEAKRIRQELN